MITAIKAKEITLKVWRYLEKHPEIRGKGRLPKYLYKTIENYLNECPLYEYFHSVKNRKRVGSCKPCPLKSCSRSSGLFVKWVFSDNYDIRQKMAAGIVKKVDAWRPE